MITATINNLPGYQIYRKLEDAVHAFFQKKKYLRLDLPLLSPALIPESYLEVFETEFRFFEKKEKLYLTASPELFIKRLLAEDIGDCYYLGKAFRNSEPSSSLHSPEFTMLEFYKTDVDYQYLKKEIARLLLFLGKRVLTNSTIAYKNHLVDFDKKWEEITVAEAFAKYANIGKDDLFEHRRLIKKAAEKGYETNNASYADLFSQIYTQEIEPHLGVNGVPTIITDYPKEMAALAKLNPDGKTAQRFEWYIAGIELGNAYTELTDWQEQKARFHQEERMRAQTGKIAHPTDWEFIAALKKGLPPCAGMAIGIDRLAMLFAGCDRIEDLKLCYTSFYES